MERLETGEWLSVEPEEMNAPGAASGETHYIALDENTGFRLPETFKRAFFRDSEAPQL